MSLANQIYILITKVYLLHLQDSLYLLLMGISASGNLQYLSNPPFSIGLEVMVNSPFRVAGSFGSTSS